MKFNQVWTLSSVLIEKSLEWIARSGGQIVYQSPSCIVFRFTDGETVRIFCIDGGVQFHFPLRVDADTQITFENTVLTMDKIVAYLTMELARHENEAQE